MKRTGWMIGLITMLLAMALAVPAFADGSLVTENGREYIYSKPGVKARNVPAYKVKVNGVDCYYSTDQDGAAVRLTGLMETAAQRLVKLKAGGKKSMKNLKKAFKWSAKLRYRNNTKKKLKGNEAAEYYGSYGFATRSGDCNTSAYTFYWMAKVLGYDMKVVQGHVPSGTMSNLKSHTWLTMKAGKKTWYFDPDFNRTYAGKTVRTASGRRKLGTYCGFKFRYGTKGTYRYMK